MAINNSDKIIEFVTEKGMPRYEEIPNVGLYLEQVVKYINDTLEPLHLTITPSMLSNYVKKGYIDSPVKKQYYAEQIAYLIFIVVAKQVLCMENISSLLALQKSTYPIDGAYNFFCEELEYMIKMTFEKWNELEHVSEEMSYEKKVLRSVVIAVSHIIYLNYCFENSLLP
ncbi:MAG: DUF1836 domain-containing protein [Lachnospiraceae bacterium]|nr:DUF1836 domain-containing protein [Lachnospiraceae bacterium]